MENHREIKNELTWHNIPGYDWYLVSNTGRVKSIDRVVSHKLFGSVKKHGRELSPTVNDGGYYIVGLCENTFKRLERIHRLVAMAFLPNERNLTIVNHKDGDKLNNRVENLEWCTYAENNRHAFDTGLNKNRGQNCVKSKLNEVQVREIRSHFKAGKSLSEIAGLYNINVKTAWRFKNNKTWKSLQ